MLRAINWDYRKDNIIIPFLYYFNDVLSIDNHVHHIVLVHNVCNHMKLGRLGCRYSYMLYLHMQSALTCCEPQKISNGPQ